MDHAPSLPDEPSMPSPEPLRNVYPANVKTSGTRNVMTSPRPDETPNPQTRLLKLRNAGFRGSVIASRRVSPIFSSPCSVPDSFGCPPNDENASRVAEIRTLYGEDRPLSPATILQEIQNSTRRRRLSPKLGFGEIFQDKGIDENTRESLSDTSRQNLKYSDSSPYPSNAVKSKMSKLRERQRRAKGPSPRSPPVAKQGKSGKVSRAHQRSTSFESATYIEHLECQLAAANAKLDSMTSPTMNKARAARLRALENETRSLRQEVSSWEMNFEERVQEQLDGRIEVENGMNAHIQRLEEEMEVKDAREKELEWELDTLTSRIREAEGLEEINRNLERRNDFLTSLVAQSPTKLDLRSATSSPTKSHPFSRAQRRRTMLPRLPSSPGGIRLSVNSAVDGGFWSSRRLGSNSSAWASPDRTRGTIGEEERGDLCMNQQSRDAHSNSLSNTSTSSASMSFSCTRPASFHSASSVEWTSPELPCLIDVDTQIKSVNRQRRMRRFPSGLCTLKPLILPKATVSSSVPALTSNSRVGSPSSRHVSNVSLDPTIAFLSRTEDRTPISSPTQGLRQRSASWTQEETSRILENQSDPLGYFKSGVAAHFPVSSDGVLGNLNEELVIDQTPFPHARPLSLEKELELANLLSLDGFEDALIPVETETDSMLGPIPIDLAQSSTTPPIDQSLTPSKTSSEMDITPKPRPSESFVPSPPLSYCLPTLGNGRALGVFTRLTNLINRVKQEPVVLAQRLLCNAWTLGSARFGGAGWWLLGLLFRSHRRGNTSRADRETVEGYTSGNIDWDHRSATASRKKTGEGLVYDRGGKISGHVNRPRERYSPSSLSSLETSSSKGSRASLSAASLLSRKEPHFVLCDACMEPSSRRTFRLWFRFSLAMILAVGMAIKHGPGVLLMDHHMHSSHSHDEANLEKPESSADADSVNVEVMIPAMSAPARIESEDEKQDQNTDFHVVFAPIIGPEHFKADFQA